MNKLTRHTAKFFTVLQRLSDEDVSLSWIAICVVMTKFGAIISVGLLLFYTIGILAGFGHEITIYKLIGVFAILLAWPVVMGFGIGSIIFLHQQWRRMLKRLSGKKISAEQD